MDLSQDDNFKKSYTKYKYIVKHWEKKFLKTNGRIPSKYDIKEADDNVRRAYSQYYQLKTQLLEGALEGLLPGSPPAPTPPSPPFLSQLSPQPEPLCLLPSVSEIQQLVSSTDTIPEQNEVTPAQNIPDKVWGKHLNKKVSSKKAAEKKTTSNTPEITQKLFKSWSFNKRNPRKSFSTKTQGTSDSASQFSQCTEENLTPNIDKDLSQNSQNGLLSESGTYDQYFHENKNINTTKELEFTPQNPMRSITTSTMPRVRNIDSQWLERCNGKSFIDSIDNEADNTFGQTSQIVDEKISTNYGLRNLNIKPSLSNADEFLSTDCIENSESENDELNSTYKKIKPVVKRQKIEPKPESKIEDSSIDSITPEKPTKKATSKKKSIAAKAKSIKNNVKKSKKAPLKDVVEIPPNEFDELGGDKVDMPRFMISSSVLKDTKSNLIDGLAKAIALPKNFKKSVKNKETLSSKEDKLQKKIDDGSINDNFVRINIEKKVFVRGKKTMNFSRFKKQQWKNKKKALKELGPEFPEGGILKCFKCGETGHISRYCKAHKGNDLLPLEDSAEKSSHLSLQEMGSSNTNKENDVAANENLLFETINVDSVLEGLSTNTVLQKSEPLPDSFLKLLAAPINKSNDKETIEPVYSLTADQNLIDTPVEVHNALKQFGHENFRSGQEQAIMRILSGHSTLVTLSTGSGKSLCYQLPAFIYAKYNKCITLVISPLVSLMEDQVVNMPSFLHAGCLHTNQTPVQRQKIVDLIKEGGIDILLISPEAIVSGERSTGFGGLLKQLPPIAFACIDEVHCVSQWSHNFRPSYLMICRVLREKLGVKCILGLTATATKSTTNSIIEHIGIADGFDGVITNMPLPNNLTLTVSTDNRRDHALLEMLKSERFEKCNSIIVYCIRRDECQRIAGLIRTTLQDSNEVLLHTEIEKSTRKRKRYNWYAEFYHAGMSAAKRRKVQEAFMTGELKIIVATVAFGMGINKSDIRGVIHYNMPSSFESYVQEVGRAGRDSLPAQCHAFIDRDCKDKHELLRHIHSNSIERHMIRKLLQKIFIPCACKTMKMKNTNDNTTDSTMLKCQGHEVAFSIDETVQELDVPAENICTLLCYLELHKNKYIKVLSNAYISCKIISYGGFPTLLKAAQKCPPLAMAIALEKKKGNTFQNVGTFEFPVIDIAAAVGWESGLVKYHLKNLEWENENGRPKRSLLRVEFNTLGFRVMAPGDLDSTQLDVALDSLYERTQLQEKTMLCQLQEVSKMLSEVSYSSIRECNIFDKEPVYSENSNKLKKYIHEYFLRDSIIENFEFTEIKPINESHVIADVRALIATYKDCTFTGRAIARIFQGIASPNFPAIVWGRCRFWRSHLFDDFYKLSEIAKQQIMQMR